MTDQNKDKVIDRLIQVLLAISIGIASWALVTTVALERRVSVIEGNRFTAVDAARMQQTLMDAVIVRLDRIQAEVTGNRECLIKIEAGRPCD